MNPPLVLDGAAPLPSWGVIRALGADAAQFLQGQLTNDVAGLGVHQARLAGYCSAKGRLLATFVVVRTGEQEFLLACPAALLPATLKRLSMFVMRARCKLSDASAELPATGAVGASALSAAGGLATWAARTEGGVLCLRCPDVQGLARAMCFGAGLALPALEAGAWHWLEVRSGVPIIEPATVEQFVPQMINYERVGGVDFKKGCYPGQEVVARSQYRGTIKRRMFLFDLPSAAAPGQEVFHSADPAQPAGMVVNAAANPAGAGWSMLAEVKLAALDTGTLHLGAPGGPVLALAPQPYEMPAEAPA